MMDFLWKINGKLRILFVFFGSMYNLHAAEEFAKTDLSNI